jgi:hypothetical protein
MPASRPRLAIQLPKSWTFQVRSAVLHMISPARFGLTYSRGWAADSANTRLRLKAALERAEEEIALLREELRIKDVRMAQLPPHRRPYYPPVERIAPRYTHTLTQRRTLRYLDPARKTSEFRPSSPTWVQP